MEDKKEEKKKGRKGAREGVPRMQLHTGADHFGNVIKSGTIKRGCS
jgi:hypothetical protein